MTILYRTLTVFFLAILGITPLTRDVFAQQENLDISESISTTSVESDGIILAEPADEMREDLWYKSERIRGNIDAGDFVVGPGRTEINIKPGETVIQEITVTNRISDNRTFKLEIEDIQGSNDGSSAVSLMAEERGPYSIRDYLTFPEEIFNLDLGERARIPVTISIPPDAEPGGFYGSVLVSTVQVGEVKEEVAPKSPIIARVGSLFFLTVEGDVYVEGKTVSLDLLDHKVWYESGPIELGILYENTGSLHVNPYGELSVKNMLGEEVGFVEIEPWFVLPKSLRIREITWDREFLLGRYTVDAKINRGYEDVVDEVSVSFWVLPWRTVGGLFLTLFIVIFSFRAFFRTFEFKRKGE
jgi:hypothetical protein